MLGLFLKHEKFLRSGKEKKMEEWKKQEKRSKIKIKTIYSKISHLKWKIAELERLHANFIDEHRTWLLLTKNPLYCALHSFLPKNLIELCLSFS